MIRGINTLGRTFFNSRYKAKIIRTFVQIPAARKLRLYPAIQPLENKRNKYEFLVKENLLPLLNADFIVSATVDCQGRMENDANTAQNITIFLFCFF